MDCHSILISHFVELVDTDDTSVGEHHRTSLQVELSLEKPVIYCLSLWTERQRSKQSLTVLTSRCTEAVRPAADEPFPEVYTEIGET
jgi:hypothetical protein